MKKGGLKGIQVILLLILMTVGNMALAQPPGRSLNFSGNNNKVFGTIGLIPNFGGPYSFQVRARYSPVVFGAQVCIAAQSRNFYIAQSPQGKIILGDGDTTAVNFPQDNEWHSYTVTSTSADFRLYLDGSLVYSKGAPKPAPFLTNIGGDTSGRFYIGTDWSGIDRYFQGDIDEIRIYNRELASAEIQGNNDCEIRHQGLDLLALYHFNQGVDGVNNTNITSLIDSSAYQNNLPLVGFTLSGSLSNFTAATPVQPNAICSTFCLPAEGPQNISIPNPCRGLSTTLSVTQGNLNNASTWYWYADGCGNTLIDSGATIQYIPTNSFTTLFVRGEGGCPLPGNCNTASFFAPTGPDVNFTSSFTASCDSVNGTGTVTIEAEDDGGDFQVSYILIRDTSQFGDINSGGFFDGLRGGTYYANVTYDNGCYNPGSNDTLVIPELTLSQCIVPDFIPPDSGYVPSPIGATLTQIIIDSTILTDTTINPGLSFETDGNKVLIDVIAVEGQKATLLALLQTPAYGLTNVYPNGEDTLTITGFYPAANLPLLAPLYPSLLRFAEVNRRPINNTEEQGIAVSQGDQSMNSNTARGAFRVTGKDVKVGVISNSYNTLPGDNASIDVSNYDLPGTGNPYNSNPVSVLEDYPYGPQSDEGRAMMQIVHDIAPDAQLAFKTGFITAGHFAESIIALANDSCDVIVDDVTYVTEPFFTDGIVAKAVDEVAAMGVTYFSAAGNFGKASYEGNFNATTAPAGFSGEAHDFAGGDVMQSVSLKPGVYTIVLQWEDSIYSLGQLSGASTDLDIYLLDKNGNLLFGFNRDNTGEDPIELLPFVVNGTIDANLLILRRSGNTPIRFKYIAFRGDIVINEHNQGTGTCVGQANAEGAIAVGSVLYNNTPYYGNYGPTVSSFSSRGGVLIDGIDRQKPDFSAPNGVNTTVELGGVNIDGDIFPNFFGTSAAAPHAAGLAALVLEGKKKYDFETLNPSSLRSLMKSGTYDMYDPGYDDNSGTGLINADSTLGKFASPIPDIFYAYNADYWLTPGAQPITAYVGCTYCNPNTKVIFQYDTITPSLVSSYYLEVSIPAFTGNPPLYLYNGPISLSQQDGGNSDSAYFFSVPNRNVAVTVDNKSKKYGEKLPAFSFTVTIDGLPLDSFPGISLDSLGLNDITYTTPATANSNVGNYFIKATSAVTDLSIPKSLELSKLYTYSFVNGILSIGKMPVTIRPNDTTLIYGDKLGGFTYLFNYEDSAIDPANRDAFRDSLNSAYLKDIADAVALVDSRVAVGPRTLTASDLENLSFLASTRSLANTRNGGTSKALVNGSIVNDTTYFVDVAVASVFNYQVNQDSTILEETLPLVNPRALVSTLALLNGTALVNTRNGGTSKALVNTRNGGTSKALVNGSTVPDSGSFQPVAIVDEDDVNAPNGDSLSFNSIALITGFVAGNHFIVPPAFMSSNFEPTYDLGNLNITPAALLITAKDTFAGCGGVQPAYSSTVERKYIINGNTVKVPGYCYTDNEDSVFTAPLQYQIFDGGNQLMGSNPLPAGNYTITPSGAQLRQPPNYTVEYANGSLSVTAPLSLTAQLSEAPCSGQNGFLSFSAAGGTTPYSFTVNGAASTSPLTLSTAGSYKVKVTDAQGCSDSSTLNFVFSTNSTAPTSATASPSLVTPGGSTTLTVNGGSLGTGASWKWYSGSCGGTPVGSGSSITVNPASTTTYFVRAEGLCNTTTCVSVTVTIANCGPTSISSSSPNNTICSGQSVYLYVRGSLLSGSSWRWYRSSCGNGTPRSSIGSDSVIRVAPTTTTTYYVRSESGPCGTTQCLSITIIVKNVPAKPGTISGPAAGLCNQQNITYSIAPMADATSYFWGIPGGMVLVSGQGTNSITVNVGSLLTNGTSTSSSSVCVRSINECGTGIWSCLTVSLKPAFTTQISGPSNLVAFTTGTYSIAPAFGATSYRWTVPSGWSIVSGQGTLSVVVRAGKSNGYVRVTPSNSCGTGPYTNKNVTVTAARPGTGNEIQDIRIWPNPAITELIIDPGGLEPLRMELADAQGRIVFRSNWSASINVSSYAPGMYLLRLFTAEGVKTRKVVIATPR